MVGRQRLGLIFGGRSVEHEVSVVSAQHVIAAADPTRFEVVPIGVTKEGLWLTPAETASQLAKPDVPFKKRLSSPSGPPSPQAERGLGGEVLVSLQSLDVVFPLVHGTHGEDGTLQGLLELLDLPYVGCGVAASAIGMDKALMKAVFAAAGIGIVDHVVFRASDSDEDVLKRASEVEERIGYPAFVKPANGGSSVGVSKVRSREELVTAFAVAAQHDRKLVVERGVEAREVECGILGNEDAQASPVGTVRFKRDFYDYEAKYLDPETEVIAPADLPPDVVARVQELSLRAYHAIDGSGMSRVDFFLLADNSLIIDEINTIPGFTPASMFPRLWQAAGVSYSELITRLVDFALTRYRARPAPGLERGST
jgi:D-alanine-D-alanine ligase